MGNLDERTDKGGASGRVIAIRYGQWACDIQCGRADGVRRCAVGWEAIENVSFWLDDGTVFENVKVEAIRGSVLFVGGHGGEVQEVNANSVIRMVVGAASGVLCGGVSR